MKKVRCDCKLCAKCIYGDVIYWRYEELEICNYLLITSHMRGKTGKSCKHYTPKENAVRSEMVC